MSRRRDAILREMGLAPLWRLRGSEPVAAEPALAAAPAETVAMPAEAVPAPERMPMPMPEPRRVRPDLREGMQQGAIKAAAPALPVPRPDGGEAVSGLDWETLEAR